MLIYSFSKLPVINLLKLSRTLRFVRFINMDRLTKIGTHDGTFHCDEVLGCYMLKLLSPNAVVIRSRNLEILNSCDIVIDVGGKYDPNKKWFDHHQSDFNMTASSFISGKPYDIRLSSAGLIYCHFGKDIIKKILGKIDDNIVEALFVRMYEGFIQEIDAIDNGIPICDGKERYYISTHLSARVKSLNPRWNESNPDVEKAFVNAMHMVGSEFQSKLEHIYRDWWPARGIVLEAIKKRYDVDSSGEIIELSQFCPWTVHLFDLEQELNISPKITYVVFPASLSRDIYRVQSVPKESSSFVLRRPLHEDWRGLRDEELSNVSGIKGCIFVHSTGFIGGNVSRNGALEMAQRSMQGNK